MGWRTKGEPIPLQNMDGIGPSWSLTVDYCRLMRYLILLDVSDDEEHTHTVVCRRMQVTTHRASGQNESGIHTLRFEIKRIAGAKARMERQRQESRDGQHAHRPAVPSPHDETKDPSCDELGNLSGLEYVRTHTAHTGGW